MAPERQIVNLKVGDIQGLEVYLEAVPAKETRVCCLRIVKSPGAMITVQDSMKHGFSFIELLNVIGKADRTMIMQFFCPGLLNAEFRSFGTFGSNDKGEFEAGYVIRSTGTAHDEIWLSDASDTRRYG